MKPVKFTAVARREVDQVARYYEGKKEGLGADFYERVDEAVRTIRETRKVIKGYSRN